MDIILERCTILYGLCDSLIQNLLDRGGKNRRALLAGNVKRLQEIPLNEDLLLKI
jgi:hypothetical protein